MNCFSQAQLLKWIVTMTTGTSFIFQTVARGSRIKVFSEQ